MAQKGSRPPAAKPDLKTAKVICFLGGPGSGKGTQCELLAKKNGYIHLSSGDLLRAEVAKKTDFGKELQAIMDKGGLVESAQVLKILKNEMIAKLPTAKGYILDGYPRTVDQAITLDKEVVPVQYVIYIMVSDDAMKQRLLKRGETSGRSDDNEATIAKRLVTYHAETEPVIEYYDKMKKCRKIDASGSIEETHVKVMKAVGI